MEIRVGLSGEGPVEIRGGQGKELRKDGTQLSPDAI